MKIFDMAGRGLAVLLMLGVLAGCGHFEKPVEKPVVLPQSFIKIFEQAEKYGEVRGLDHYDLDEPVRVFAQGCCKTEETAVRLLQRNWFKIVEGAKFCEAGEMAEKRRPREKTPVMCGAEPVTPLKHELESASFDKIYVAERQTDVLPYMPSYTVYRVMLYVKDGKIVRYRAARFVRDN